MGMKFYIIINASITAFTRDMLQPAIQQIVSTLIKVNMYVIYILCNYMTYVHVHLYVTATMRIKFIT